MTSLADFPTAEELAAHLAIPSTGRLPTRWHEPRRRISRPIYSPADLKEERQVERDAQRTIALKMPCPIEFAFHLPAVFVEALVTAWRSNDRANQGCLRVSDAIACEMQPLGLVGCGGPWLTAFGSSVRKALRSEAQ